MRQTDLDCSEWSIVTAMFQSFYFKHLRTLIAIAVDPNDGADKNKNSCAGRGAELPLV